MVTILAAFFLTGCDSGSFSPPLPGGEDYEEENSEIAYIKVSPAKSEMKFNQSKTFEVKAYNSDKKLVKLSAEKIKWSAKYTKCVACRDFKLSPIEGSLYTTFTPNNPKKPGLYEVWAKLEGDEVKWGKATVDVN